MVLSVAELNLKPYAQIKCKKLQRVKKIREHIKQIKYTLLLKNNLWGKSPDVLNTLNLQGHKPLGYEPNILNILKAHGEKPPLCKSDVQNILIPLKNGIAYKGLEVPFIFKEKDLSICNRECNYTKSLQADCNKTNNNH